MKFAFIMLLIFLAVGLLLYFSGSYPPDDWDNGDIS